VTDWHNVRDVPLAEGRFGLDEYIQVLIDFLAEMGPGASVVAVCQPCVAALAAVSVMSEDQHPATPVSLVLMALLSEAAVLRLRRRAVMPALRDLSATVTAVLLALALMIIGIGVAPSPLLAIASDNGHKVGAAMQPEVK
jgi:NADH:ubiquinone oxidoreductase subunit 4 (subunit M)